MKDCSTCSFGGRPIYKFPCSSCLYDGKNMTMYAPQHRETNADKIRAMSDEQLAEMRAEIQIDCIEKLAPYCEGNFNYSKQQMIEGNLQWLKQEAEE